MDGDNEPDRRPRQIEHLLRFPGVGALGEPAIASNLGVPPGTLDGVLQALKEAGVVVQLEDGRFAALAVRNGE